MENLIENKSIVEIIVPVGKIYQFKHVRSLVKQTVKIIVLSGAQCYLTSFTKDDAHDCDITYEIVIQEKAQFYMIIGMMQEKKINCSITLYLQGVDAKADVKGMYVLDGEQKVTIATNQYHHAAQTDSAVVMKGMLKDDSIAHYTGLIHLDGESQGAKAGQENKNILLSDRARVQSIPSIQVLQHDVQCSHGSAVGKFDAAHMWYLQSKGFSVERLKALLIETFFSDVLDEYDKKDIVIKNICKKMV